jgi:hypothetical protein
MCPRAVSFVSGSESSDDLESLEGSSEDEELAEAVFVSRPEPAWLTRDWRRRLWNARCVYCVEYGVGSSASCWETSSRHRTSHPKQLPLAT